MFYPILGVLKTILYSLCLSHRLSVSIKSHKESKSLLRRWFSCDHAGWGCRQQKDHLSSFMISTRQLGPKHGIHFWNCSHDLMFHDPMFPVNCSSRPVSFLRLESNKHLNIIYKVTSHLSVVTLLKPLQCLFLACLPQAVPPALHSSKREIIWLRGDLTAVLNRSPSQRCAGSSEWCLKWFETECFNIFWGLDDLEQHLSPSFKLIFFPSMVSVCCKAMCSRNASPRRTGESQLMLIGKII